jgi:hypothetical protein
MSEKRGRGRPPGKSNLKALRMKRASGGAKKGEPKSSFRDYTNYFSPPRPDNLPDVEATAAKRDKRKVDLAAAYPDPAPKAKRKYTKKAQINSATGEVIGEPLEGEMVVSGTMPGPPEIGPNDDGPEEGEIDGSVSDYSSLTNRVKGEEIRRTMRRLSGVPSYLKEYRLKMMHQLILRGTNLHEIANMLGIDVTTTNAYRRELGLRLAEEAGRVDTMEFFGKSDAFYDEVRAMAMQMADDAGVRIHNRVAALQTALSAEADRQRFYHLMGVFQKMPWMPNALIQSDRHHKNAEDLLSMLASFATELTDSSETPVEPIAEDPDNE